MNWLMTIIDADGKGHAEGGSFYGNHKEAKAYGQAKADMERVEVGMFSENGHFMFIEPKHIEYTLRRCSTGDLIGLTYENAQNAEEHAQSLAWEMGDVVALLENGIVVKIVGSTGTLLNLA